MQATADLYRTLQVDPGAEDVVIHAAYRALMRRHHPDRGGDLAHAQRLTQAYATLRDPRARRSYDRLYQLERHIAQLRAASPGAEAPVVGGPGLGAGFARRFTPVAEAGCAWMFDHTAALRESPHSWVWIKRFPHGQAADADGFRMRIEATRLLRPLWHWHLDVFVALLHGTLTEPFRALLREPSGPLWWLGHAVVVVERSAGVVHSVGRARELPVVRALADAVRAA